MTEICDNCPRLFCDFVAQDCRLSNRQVVDLRPALLLTPTVVEPKRRPLSGIAEIKRAVAALGFKKYNKRYKPETPQRLLWRSYKAKAKARVLAG